LSAALNPSFLDQLKNIYEIKVQTLSNQMQLNKKRSKDEQIMPIALPDPMFEANLANW